MVVAANDAFADWCRSSIDLGPGGILSPLVIGPAAVPVVDDAALAAALHLSDDRAVPYSDLIYAALSEAAKAALEDLMAAGTYQFQSDFAKKHQALGRTE